MTKYNLTIGQATFLVIEDIRDIQLKFKGDTPSEIQIWQVSHYYLGADLIRTDDAKCTVIKLINDIDIDHPGDRAFGSTGVTLSQAIAILGVIASGYSELPSNADLSSVVRPTIPDGVTSQLAALNDHKAELLADIDNLINQADERTVLMQNLRNELDRMTAEVDLQRKQYNEAQEEASRDLINLGQQAKALDDQIEEKTAIVNRLAQAIIDKSESSTSATVQLEQTLGAIGMADRAEELPGLIRAQEKALQDLEAKAAAKLEEINDQVRRKQEELDEIDRDIAARRA